MTTEISIASLARYPVKGLSPDPLDQVALDAEATFPLDRAWAIEVGARRFDAGNPQHLPKVAFAQLMSQERLAGLETRFDADGHTLTVLRAGKQVARGSLADPVGRKLLEQFFAAYLSGDIRGIPKIVHAPGHHFCDVPARMVSLVNLATVRDIARVTGKPVAPARFRANILVDGPEPWEEFGWLGRRLSGGSGVVLKVAERIERCQATSVDPGTGVRDINIPRVLTSSFEHQDCGLYLTVETGGSLRAGERLRLD